MTESTEKPSSIKKGAWGGAGRNQGRKPITGMVPADGKPYDILEDPVACNIVNSIRRILEGKGGHRDEKEVHTAEYNRRNLSREEDKRSYDLLVQNNVGYSSAKRELEASLKAYMQQILDALSVTKEEWNEMTEIQKRYKVRSCRGLSSQLAAKWTHIQEQQKVLKKILAVRGSTQFVASKSFRFPMPQSHGKQLARAFENVSKESFQTYHVHLTKSQVAEIWKRWHKRQSEVLR